MIRSSIGLPPCPAPERRGPRRFVAGGRSIARVRFAADRPGRSRGRHGVGFEPAAQAGQPAGQRVGRPVPEPALQGPDPADQVADLRGAWRRDRGGSGGRGVRGTGPRRRGHSAGSTRGSSVGLGGPRPPAGSIPGPRGRHGAIVPGGPAPGRADPRGPRFNRGPFPAWAGKGPERPRRPGSR